MIVKKALTSLGDASGGESDNKGHKNQSLLVLMTFSELEADEDDNETK